MPLIRRMIVGVTAAVVVTACDFRHSSRNRDLANVLEEVGRQFFQAAATNDSVALDTLSVGSPPQDFVRHFVVEDQGLLKAGADGIEIEFVDKTASLAIASFSFAYRGKDEVMILRFIQDGNRWKVTQISLSSSL